MGKRPKTKFTYEIAEGDAMTEQEFDQLCQMLAEIILRQIRKEQTIPKMDGKDPQSSDSKE